MPEARTVRAYTTIVGLILTIGALVGLRLIEQDTAEDRDQQQAVNLSLLEQLDAGCGDPVQRPVLISRGVLCDNIAEAVTAVENDDTPPPVVVAGVDGSDGDDGGRGATGATGPAGADGRRGPRGFIGPVGPAGPSGETGATGATGSTGATGPKGDTGSAGPQGPAGPAGTQGQNGQDGAPGADGRGITSLTCSPESEMFIVTYTDGTSEPVMGSDCVAGLLEP